MTTIIDQNEHHQINKLYYKLLNDVSAALSRAYEIGDLLLKTKKQLPPDEFRPWLMMNVKFSESVAANYVAASECEENFVLAVVDYLAVTCRSVKCGLHTTIEQDCEVCPFGTQDQK